MAITATVTRGKTWTNGDTANSEALNAAALPSVSISGAVELLTASIHTEHFTATVGHIYHMNGAITGTLGGPTAPTDGAELVVVNIGTEVAYIATTSPDVFNGQAGFDSLPLAPGESVRITASGGKWILS